MVNEVETEEVILNDEQIEKKLEEFRFKRLPESDPQPTKNQPKLFKTPSAKTEANKMTSSPTENTGSGSEDSKEREAEGSMEVNKDEEDESMGDSENLFCSLGKKKMREENSGLTKPLVKVNFKIGKKRVKCEDRSETQKSIVTKKKIEQTQEGEANSKDLLPSSLWGNYASDSD